MIGFVIPSIGRFTLSYTLNSILQQTNPNWRCFVGFDGKEKKDIDTSLLIQDDRISYFYFNEKLGSENEHHGNAGEVRNAIIDRIQNDVEWIAFVDDDDTLSKYYVEIFELEQTKQEFDCCVFRMRYDINNEKIIPPLDMNYLAQNFVGISFCVNKKFIDKHNIRFRNSNSEDFIFLKNIEENKGRIHISPHITYNVNGHLYYG